MTDYSKDLEFLTKNQLFPDSDYFKPERFTKPYANTKEFYEGIMTIPCLPIANGVAACFYAIRTVWAALRAIGNLLILKPGFAGEATQDLGVYGVLTLSLAVMAPINALVTTLELLTRIISSWFSGKESVEDLSKLDYKTQWTTEAEKYKRFLPSTTYFNRERFFSPYKNVFDCLGQLAAPIISPVQSSVGFLQQALTAIFFAIDGISNLVIGKPQHALQDFRYCSIHTSLSLSLAVMTAINPVIEAAAFLSRLGSTWFQACMGPQIEDNRSQVRAGM